MNVTNHVPHTCLGGFHGVVCLFQDCLLMACTTELAQVETGSTEPLQPGGALMLGADQDCYAGCTDSTQAYHGLMDEVQQSLACFIASCMMALRPA